MNREFFEARREPARLFHPTYRAFHYVSSSVLHFVKAGISSFIFFRRHDVFNPPSFKPFSHSAGRITFVASQRVRPSFRSAGASASNANGVDKRFE